MQPGPYEQVPLTEDDRNLLMAVYKVRRRILLMACFFVMFMAFLGSQHGIDNYDRYTGKLVSRWEETYDSRFLNRMGIWMVNIGFLEIPLGSCFLLIWYKKVRPITRDLKAGVKDIIPYQIIRKEYFPLTGRFYVALDDPNYLHHEIDEDTYYNCSEGGFIYVYRAPKSKFVFEESGRFIIL